MMGRIRVVILVAAMLGAAANATAAVSESDLQIAARALSFMTNAPSGTVRVGIVFDPNNPQSAADAAQLEQLMAGGLRVGNVTLQPVQVPIAQIGSAQVGLFFLTEGAGTTERLSEVASANKVACITTDLAQVRGGACAIGIRSGPRVEILVNRAAADSSGVSFSTAFRMLITEF
jgi:hypothetical protein